MSGGTGDCHQGGIVSRWQGCSCCCDNLRDESLLTGTLWILRLSKWSVVGGSILSPWIPGTVAPFVAFLTRMSRLTHFALETRKSVDWAAGARNPFLGLFTAFPEVTHFSLRGSGIQDCDVDTSVASLAHLCPRLEQLRLSCCKMSDESLRILASLQHLKSLMVEFGENRFTFEGVQLLLRGAARRSLTYMQLWCIDKFDEKLLLQEVAAVTQATRRQLLRSRACQLTVLDPADQS